jgi:hypothetical protein
MNLNFTYRNLNLAVTVYMFSKLMIDSLSK